MPRRTSKTSKQKIAPRVLLSRLDESSLVAIFAEVQAFEALRTILERCAEINEWAPFNQSEMQSAYEELGYRGRIQLQPLLREGWLVYMIDEIEPYRVSAKLVSTLIKVRKTRCK